MIAALLFLLWNGLVLSATSLQLYWIALRLKVRGKNLLCLTRFLPYYASYLGTCMAVLRSSYGPQHRFRPSALTAVTRLVLAIRAVGDVEERLDSGKLVGSS